MGWFSRESDSGANEHSAPTPGTVMALDTATRGLVRWLRGLGGALPARSMELCRVIVDHLDDVVSDPASERLDVQTLVTLERTASAHVPDTVRAFLAARGTDGAETMLYDQLVVLERVTASASGRGREAARDAFEIQGAFLHEKFGELQ